MSTSLSDFCREFGQIDFEATEKAAIGRALSLCADFIDESDPTLIAIANAIDTDQSYLKFSGGFTKHRAATIFLFFLSVHRDKLFTPIARCNLAGLLGENSETLDQVKNLDVLADDVLEIIQPFHNQIQQRVAEHFESRRSVKRHQPATPSATPTPKKILGGAIRIARGPVTPFKSPQKISGPSGFSPNKLLSSSTSRTITYADENMSDSTRSMQSKVAGQSEVVSQQDSERPVTVHRKPISVSQDIAIPSVNDSETPVYQAVTSQLTAARSEVDALTQQLLVATNNEAAMQSSLVAANDRASELHHSNLRLQQQNEELQGHNHQLVQQNSVLQTETANQKILIDELNEKLRLAQAEQFGDDNVAAEADVEPQSLTVTESSNGRL